jgi:hypothetical protein
MTLECAGRQPAPAEQPLSAGDRVVRSCFGYPNGAMEHGLTVRPVAVDEERRGEPFATHSYAVVRAARAATRPTNNPHDRVAGGPANV